MKTFIAVIALSFASMNAHACGNSDFAASVFLFGESAFAGVVLSGCPRDAEVNVRVRLISRNFAPLGTATVVAHVPAGRMAVFEGTFPPRKMANAVPLNSEVRVIDSRTIGRPGGGLSEGTEPIKNADFADLAQAGPLPAPID